MQGLTSAEEQKQNDANSKMLKDEKGADPSNLKYATKVSVQAYCQTVGKQDTKISETPHA